jgi:hypothetical protein
MTRRGYLVCKEWKSLRLSLRLDIFLQVSGNWQVLPLAKSAYCSNGSTDVLPAAVGIIVLGDRHPHLQHW